MQVNRGSQHRAFGVTPDSWRRAELSLRAACLIRINLRLDLGENVLQSFILLLHIRRDIALCILLRHRLHNGLHRVAQVYVQDKVLIDVVADRDRLIIVSLIDHGRLRLLRPLGLLHCWLGLCRLCLLIAPQGLEETSQVLLELLASRPQASLLRCLRHLYLGDWLQTEQLHYLHVTWLVRLTTRVLVLARGLGPSRRLDG